MKLLLLLLALNARAAAPEVIDGGVKLVQCLDVDGTPESCGGSASSGLTDAELRATPVPVSGSFAVSGSSVVITTPDGNTVPLPVTGTFWQGTQPVSGTFWQATQPVSGPLTDTQLRAVAVPVSGTFYQATQPVSLSALPSLVAGTANIGDVDVLSLPAIPSGTNNIGDVDVLTLPALAAGTAQIGTVHGSSVTITPIQVAAAINDGGCTSITVSATVLASNTSRRSYSVCSVSANTALTYIKLGTTATTSDFPLSPGQCFNSDAAIVYTGVIDAIAASGTQSICVISL